MQPAKVISTFRGWRGGWAVVAAVVVASPAFADVIGFQQGVSPDALYESADSTIRSDNPTSNFGTSGDVILGKTTAPAVIRGVYAFDLAAIPVGATIDAVSLRLVGSRDDTGSGSQEVTLELVALTNAFAENEVTWNHRLSTTAWGTAGGDLGATLSTTTANPDTFTGGSVMTFDSTASLVSAVQSVADAEGVFYFAIKTESSVEAASARRIFFVNGDAATTAANRPLLSVTYTPVPEPGAALAMAGLALAGLGSRRRRGQ
ncbi:MAG TPA: DNRLRE domain-containing protein [Tepidisphaeraceae bacterium]|nr:DNRLRE domain-containing protein [Tepidisphaeraceae bacterium]